MGSPEGLRHCLDHILRVTKPNTKRATIICPNSLSQIGAWGLRLNYIVWRAERTLRFSLVPKVIRVYAEKAALMLPVIARQRLLPEELRDKAASGVTDGGPRAARTLSNRQQQSSHAEREATLNWPNLAMLCLLLQDLL